MKQQMNPQLQEQIFATYKNIKHLREKHSLSTAKMAQIIGISERKLISAENCETTGVLTDRHLRNLCVHFGVSADALFDERWYEADE